MPRKFISSGIWLEEMPNVIRKLKELGIKKFKIVKYTPHMFYVEYWSGMKAHEEFEEWLLKHSHRNFGKVVDEYSLLNLSRG